MVARVWGDEQVECGGVLGQQNHSVWHWSSRYP